MSRRLNHLIAVALIGFTLLAVVACSGSGARTTTSTPAPHLEGLAVVVNSACSTKQLTGISRSTGRTLIRVRSVAPGYVNTPKTAVKIQLGTLLVVKLKERNTDHLAITAHGCWVRPESHITRGLMTVAFLMNQTGYAGLVSMKAVAIGADAGARATYLHVVRN
jgi:NAD(P)-dependent dehydrogenase (short-subunit alcohol dehydrogenase family)